jgi:uncharacterized protein with PIN domain
MAFTAGWGIIRKLRSPRGAHAARAASSSPIVGDCFAYAVEKVTAVGLLVKGQDFRQPALKAL